MATGSMRTARATAGAAARSAAAMIPRAGVARTGASVALTFPLHQLAPAENDVGAKGLKPGDEAQVATCLADLQGGAEGLADLRRVAAFADALGKVRAEFFIDFAIHAAAPKCVGYARPKRHLTPSSALDLQPSLRSASGIPHRRVASCRPE